MKTVLIVEDEKDVREIIQTALERWGYEVLEAGDGLEALQILKSRTPDAIISDIIMPQMDGFELIKILKTNEKTRSIPVIMLTRKEAFEDIYKSYEQGIDDYIPKPFDVEMLRQSLDNILEK